MAKDGDKFHTVQKGMSNKAELDKVMLDCLSQTDSGKLTENFQYIIQSFHDEAVYVPLTVTSFWMTPFILIQEACLHRGRHMQKSGCGKSTLCRTVAGIEKPDTGAVFYEGKRAAFKSPVGFEREL